MAGTVICYTHVTPRLVRRIQCLADRVRELVVLEIAGSERVYPWWEGRYNVKQVRQVQLFDAPLEQLSERRIVDSVKVFLEQERPKVAILSGYDRVYMRYTARWVKEHGGRTILPTVTWSGDRQRWWLKEWMKGLIVSRLFDAACVGGERSRAYCLSLGFSERQIWKSFNVVDNEHFTTGAELARRNACALGQPLGVPAQYFLYVGAMERWKNLSFLLDCYDSYRSGGGRWGLVLVGTGSEFTALRVRAEELGTEDIVFAGMKTYAETPAYYGLASCLVLPSLSETWGLVVNEAAAAGLPILASNRCGCVPELVHRGINGYAFEPWDKAEFVRLMHLMSDGSSDVVRMGQASRRLIQYFTPEHWADAVADCVRHLQGA